MARSAAAVIIFLKAGTTTPNICFIAPTTDIHYLTQPILLYANKIISKMGNSPEVDDVVTEDGSTQIYTDFSVIPENATLDDITHLVDISEEKLKMFGHSTYQKSGKRKGPSTSFVFPTKLYEILSCKDISDSIAWLPHGRSWRILNKKKFEAILQKYFNHSNISSFVRQVNGWGFRRIRKGPNKHSYYSELFLRGKKHLIQFISRESPDKSKTQDPDFSTLPPLSQEDNKKTQKEQAKGDGSYLTPSPATMNAPSNLSHLSYGSNSPQALSFIMPVADAPNVPQIGGNCPGYEQPYAYQPLKGQLPHSYNQSETKRYDSTYLPYQQSAKHFQYGNCEHGPQMHMHDRQFVPCVSKYKPSQSPSTTDSYRTQYSPPSHQKCHQPAYGSPEKCTDNSQESRYNTDHHWVCTSPIKTAKLSQGGDKSCYSLSEEGGYSKRIKRRSSNVAGYPVYKCLKTSNNENWYTSRTLCHTSALTHVSHNQQPKSTVPSYTSSKVKPQSQMYSIPQFPVIRPEPYIKKQGHSPFDKAWQECDSLFSSTSALTHVSHNQQPKSTLSSNISSEAKHQSQMYSIPQYPAIQPAPYIETQEDPSFDAGWQEFGSLFSDL